MRISSKINKYTLLDSCFWIALYEEKDKNHETAQEIAEDIFKTNIVIPWPTLYEFMNTRFTKREENIINFQRIIKNPNTFLIEDNDYRKDSLDIFFRLNLSQRKLSLVDIIIRAIIEDKKIKIDTLVTFNPGDFQDICRKKRVELLDRV